MSTQPPLSPETVAVTSGRPPHEPDQPLNAPVVFASTFVGGGDYEYGRYANPTWEAFETVLGTLEGGRCLTFSTGMAAASALLDLVSPGETVVAPRHAYLGVLHVMADLQARGRLDIRTVDVDDTDSVVAAVRETDAAVLWLESPTNPALEVADLATICSGVADTGATIVVDNTFATPLRQRPLDLGAHVVLHSATKILSGHGDVLLGAVVTRDEATFRALDERRRARGAIPGTMESWLAARGVRTLAVRLDRAESNAAELARRLGAHPGLDRVRYPGFGTIVAVEVAGGAAAADLLTHSTRLWVRATSLGGVESTFERRRRWSSEPATIPDNLVRMSVGIEAVDDLWADLAQALDEVSAVPASPTAR